MLTILTLCIFATILLLGRGLFTPQPKLQPIKTKEEVARRTSRY